MTVGPLELLTPTAEMHTDLVKAQHAFVMPQKTKTAKVKMKAGGEYSYKYADLSDVIESVREVLAENGFAFVQSVSSNDGSVGVRTRLLHRTGESIEGDFLFLPAGNTPQEAGAAITYARRYSLTALLGIAADEDTDAQGVSRRKSSAPTNDGVDQPAVDGSNPAGSVSAVKEPAEPKPGEAGPPSAASPGEVAPNSASPGPTSPAGIGEGPNGATGSSGEASTETDSASPEHRFTTKASECSHRTPTDDWVATIQVNGQPRCSLCGTPAVRYREAS